MVALLWLLAQAPVIDLEHFLGRHIGLDAVSIQAVKNGSIVTKRLPSDDGREIAVFGIARVAFPAEFLSSRFRNIEVFKKSYAVPEVGRFGETPSLSDLAGLSVPRKDLEALAAYEDKEAAVPLRQDFESILEASSYLLDYVPELASYLREYPDSELQLYASHYFDSSLGLTALLEVEEEGQSPARYLVYLNRSRSLDLGGFFGGLKRSVVGGKILDGLEMNLLYTRARLQAIYRQQQLLER